MSTFKWIGLTVAASCAVVALLAWQHSSSLDEAQAQKNKLTHQEPSWPQQAGTTSPQKNTAEMGMSLPKVSSDGQGRSPLDAVASPRFKVDARGQLEMTSQTRDGIEQIAALYGDDRDKARDKLAEATQDLPAAAQRAAQDLYQRYQQYMQAVRQTFPPELQEDMSLQQAEEAFAKLQRVRETYMGDAGKELWTRDDAITRKLLDYSGEYLKSDPKLSLIEANQLAQDRYAHEAEAMQGRAKQP